MKCYFVLFFGLLFSFSSFGSLVTGTNYNIAGTPVDIDMTFTSSNAFNAVPGGIVVKNSILVPTTNGAYAINIPAGIYNSIANGRLLWTFAVTETTNTLKMVDLIISSPGVISFSPMWGTKIYSNDSSAGYLAEKITAGTNVIIYIETNNNSQRLVINASASDLTAALAQTNAALTMVDQTNAANILIVSNAIPMTASNLLTIVSGENYQLTTINRRSDGIATNATVLWPDGTFGVFTTIVIGTNSSGDTSIDSYQLTYTNSSKTITQPSVVRNADGSVTNKPALTIF